MKYLVVSDIHGNWPALEAVLKQARGYDEVLFIGDAVGYYPDAEKVVTWLRESGAKGVMGNHDVWLLDYKRPVDGPVMEILAWQRERISPENLEYLKALPWTLEVSGAYLVHGSPVEPLAYLEENHEAKEAFEKVSNRWVFIGHSHIAGAFLTIPGETEPWIRFQRYSPGGELILAPRARAIINPGSVGQPRDGNPGAAYAIWDTDEGNVEYFRPKYNLEEVLARIHHENFPMWLYERLVLGK